MTLKIKLPVCFRAAPSVCSIQGPWRRGGRQRKQQPQQQPKQQQQHQQREQRQQQQQHQWWRAPALHVLQVDATGVPAAAARASASATSPVQTWSVGEHMKLVYTNNVYYTWWRASHMYQRSKFGALARVENELYFAVTVTVLYDCSGVSERVGLSLSCKGDYTRFAMPHCPCDG